MRLLLSGGLQRKNARDLPSGQKHERASLLALDTGTGEYSVLLEYQSDPHHRPAELPEIRFTAADLSAQDILVPTSTELVRIDRHSAQIQAVHSLPSYNDIHHVRRVEGQWLVANTGLDEVVAVDERSGTIEQRIYLGRTPFEQRFDPSIDYRVVNHTGKHEVHPNFISRFKGQTYVTGGFEGTVIPLADPAARFRISEQVVHDGIWHRDALWFTSVDGWIITIDPAEARVLDRFDLNAMDGRGANMGWCRGLYLEGQLALVGFSALRPTTNQRLVRWVNETVGRGEEPRRSRVALFDLEARRLLGEFQLPVGRMSDVFSIHRVD